MDSSRKNDVDKLNKTHSDDHSDSCEKLVNFDCMSQDIKDKDID